MKLRCLIADDEPLAREILENYIADTPGLDLAASCTSALQAMEVLNSDKIDLLFLDISMPRLTGIEMLRALEVYPTVILTTAYPDYAIEGYELEVADYLLKPFSFERFLKAVQKVMSRFEKQDNREKTILLKADKKTWSVPLSNILCVASEADYLIYYTHDRKIMTLGTLKNLETELDSAAFCRVHKSWVVARSAIDFIEGNMIHLRNGMEIPVGKSHKDTLMSWMG